MQQKADLGLASSFMHAPQCSVFVSRLPPVDNVEECLYGLFSADGLIKQVRVLVSRMNPPSKFAFVSFADVDAAQKALARNNQPFMGVFLNVSGRGLGKTCADASRPGPSARE